MSHPANVLLLCTDQHRYDVISTHPGSRAITPALQGLADAGTVFEHCYASNPVCAPTRASILTGQMPDRHGLWANGVTLPAPRDLISHELAKEGYRCGLVGKLHLSAAFEGRTERRLDDGFEVFEWAHDPFHGSPENGYHAWLRDRFPDLWAEAQGDRVTPEIDNFVHRDTAFDAMPSEAHYSTWVADRACRFLETVDDRPFFLVANFFDPHHPFVAPREFVDLYPPGSVPPPVGGGVELAEKPAWQRTASGCSYAGHGPSFTDYTDEQIDEIRRVYYAMVSMADHAIGTILQTLADRGLEDDTLVIFTSDHGEMLGDHALLLKGAMMYDCAVRVPLILRWPGHVPRGHVVTGQVGSHDIAGTIRHAAGAPAQPTDQGRDLVAIATGEESARSWAMSQYRDSGYPTDPPLHTTMLRTPTHKLIVRHATGDDADGGLVRPEGELYDMTADPDELHNLYGRSDHTIVQLEMYSQLVEAMVGLEDRSAERVSPW